MKKVFLSHSSNDKTLVRQIRKALLPFNQYLWIDELEILPGDSLIGKLTEGITESDCVLVFISKNSINSKWVKEEVQSFISREIRENEIRIVPILIDSTSAPPFLSHRLQVRFNTNDYAKGVADILKGIFRCKSIFTVHPVYDKPFQLVPFVDEIENFKKDGLDGNLFIIYDIYDFNLIVNDSLIQDRQDRYQESDRLRIALHRCFDFLSAITPQLVRTVLTYFQYDVGAAPATEKTIQLIWRLVTLTLFNCMIGKFDEGKIQLIKSLNYVKVYNEITRLETIRTKYIPSNCHVGIQTLAWLEYLDQHWDNTYDIGFEGAKTSDGVNIMDAGHVRIPKYYVREDSLTIFRDTSPDQEFLPAIWVWYILPYIVANAILQQSFSGHELYEIIPRIGLRISDYYRFGIE